MCMELGDSPTGPGYLFAQNTAELDELAPPDVHDPVVDVFKQKVDRRQLAANLRLTTGERSKRFCRSMQSTERRRGLVARRSVPQVAGPETDFGQILDVLSRGGVSFIVVGGIAAMAHGGTGLTADLDLVYSRDRQNVRQLVNTIAEYQPFLGAPEGLPFTWDQGTVHAGLNFTVMTSLGDVDLFGKMAGAGGYHELLPHSVEVTIFGVNCRCATLERLIQMKRAAGRPRDLPVMAELLALLEERRKMHPDVRR
jgi:predicted nucleotidyltransferase